MDMNLASIQLTGMWGISPIFMRNKNLGISSSIQCAVRFRPCIDIHKGKVKQIVGSTLKDTAEKNTLITNFESDKSPAEFADLYKQDGLTGGHVIMLGADEASKSAATEALHAYPGGMQVGGGINSENALRYLEEGASHVIVTSHVFRDGKLDVERLKELVHIVGKHMLILDLSCRKKIPVTYAGGVTTMEDLEKIKTAGMGRVDASVGSALDIFGGDLEYKKVVAWHHQQIKESRSISLFG